jgi:hypothetical protein
MLHASTPNRHGSDRFRRYRVSMADSTTGTIICTRLAAQDRHGPKAPVPLALCAFAPRRPASTIHAHLTAPVVEATI